MEGEGRGGAGINLEINTTSHRQGGGGARERERGAEPELRKGGGRGDYGQSRLFPPVVAQPLDTCGVLSSCRKPPNHRTTEPPCTSSYCLFPTAVCISNSQVKVKVNGDALTFGRRRYRRSFCRRCLFPVAFPEASPDTATVWLWHFAESFHGQPAVIFVLEKRKSAIHMKGVDGTGGIDGFVFHLNVESILPSIQTLRYS